MNLVLEKAVEQIKNNPNFLKLKEVIENNAYHDHESVYDHLLRTYEAAKREINADFITNPDARKLYDNYVSVEVDGVKKKDLMQILALIHDIGKVIVKPEISTDGITKFPNHEQVGSEIVADFASNLPNGVIDYLAKGIRLHGVFNGTWNEHPDLKAEEILPFLKQKSEGLCVEEIFNGYCDCSRAKPFQPAIPLIYALLNLPETYE